MIGAIEDVRLRQGNVAAPLLSRLPEDLLACLDFRPNPYFAAADEQQDDSYGAVSVDYNNGSKA